MLQRCGAKHKVLFLTRIVQHGPESTFFFLLFFPCFFPPFHRKKEKKDRSQLLPGDVLDAVSQHTNHQIEYSHSVVHVTSPVYSERYSVTLSVTAGHTNLTTLDRNTRLTEPKLNL